MNRFSYIFSLFLGAFWQCTAALVDRLVSRACDIAEPRIDGDDLATCECTGSYRVIGGLKAKLLCTSNMRVCYEGTTYCGYADVDALLGARIFGRSGFLGATISVDMDTNLPVSLTNIPPPMTVRLFPTGLNFLFNTCEIFVGDQKCTSCVVCEEGVEFTYDCSNTDLAPDNALFNRTRPEELVLRFLHARAVNFDSSSRSLHDNKLFHSNVNNDKNTHE